MYLCDCALSSLQSKETFEAEMSPTLKLIREAAEQQLTVGGVWMKAESLPGGVSTTARKKLTPLQSRAVPPWWQLTIFTASAGWGNDTTSAFNVGSTLLNISVWYNGHCVKLCDYKVIQSWSRDKIDYTLIPDKSELVIFHDLCDIFRRNRLDIRLYFVYTSVLYS